MGVPRRQWPSDNAPCPRPDGTKDRAGQAAATIARKHPGVQAKAVRLQAAIAVGLFTGRAENARDKWDGKLRARGHRPRWRQVRGWPAKRYLGVCSRCGGEMECGTGPATSAGYDIRSRRCQLPCRPLLRLVKG